MDEPTRSKDSQVPPTSDTAAVHNGAGTGVNGYMNIQNNPGQPLDMQANLFDGIVDSSSGAAWSREMQNDPWLDNFPFDIGLDILSDELYK